jgi:hypothetical protein
MNSIDTGQWPMARGTLIFGRQAITALQHRRQSMRSITRNIIAAVALLVPAVAHTSMAAEALSYPRFVGSSQDGEIDYGPGSPYNILGGGHARAVGGGENTSVEYLGPTQMQPSLYAYAVGSGENTQIIYSHSPDRNAALAEAGVLPFAPSRPMAMASR